jgi:pimeloyl-ACP methyl ester carboxylesterase
MDTHLATLTADRYVTVDGLRLRYIEEGSGHPVLLLHGASLGSSADVFRRNLGPLARAGLRAIAYDFPGYGLSEVGSDLSLNYQTASVPKFMDALGLKKAALIAHSRSGGMAVQLALKEPERYSHLVVLGTGTLLPPLPEDVEGRYAQVAQRHEEAHAGGPVSYRHGNARRTGAAPQPQRRQGVRDLHRARQCRRRRWRRSASGAALEADA